MSRHLSFGEKWAEDVFLDTVCALQAITREQLGELAEKFGQGSTAAGGLAWTAERFPRYTNDPLVSEVYKRLKERMPLLLEPRFGNGDLNPSNMLVSGHALAGIIDFEFTGFFDPMSEFMAPFGWCPELRNKGLEVRFCERNGFDLGIIDWYRAATHFGSWLHLLAHPQAECEGWTASSCKAALEKWVSGS